MKFPSLIVRSAAWLVAAGLLTSVSFAELQPGTEEARIARAVGRFLPETHYNKIQVDDAFSKMLFDEYFKALDPGKLFFYASDLEEFSYYQDRLDDSIKEGDVRFAYKVFNRFMQRLQERLAFVNERLAQPFDFTVDEKLLLDREDAPWMKDESEMNKLWSKNIKNRLLLYELIDEAIKNLDEDDLTSSEKDAREDAKFFSNQTPQERVKKYYKMLESQFAEMDKTDLLELYLTTFSGIFDPHSTYMSAKTVEDFNIQMRLSLKGIGATLQGDQGYTKVTKLVNGGPADLQGDLKEGDRIIAVAQGDGQFVDVIDMPLKKVVKLIRGEKGTTVELMVLDADKGLNSKPKVVKIVRDEVQLKDAEATGELRVVRYADLDPELRELFTPENRFKAGVPSEVDAPIEVKPENEKLNEELRIGIIAIPSFYADFDALENGQSNAKTVTSDVLQILAQLKQQKIDGLILDLRSNGGGSLGEAIRLTGLFIPAGPVVQISRSKTLKPIVQYDRDRIVHYNGPLAVMVNRFSASASEIFAGAIQDYDRGVIIGDEKTHGKGTVQTVYDLKNMFALGNFFKMPDPGVLKYTIQKFYRITGASTQKHGVAPDITFKSFMDHMDTGEETLPHVLPWDEIPPASYKKVDRVNKFLPTLKQRSAERRSENEEYQELLTEIARFGEQFDVKEISLSKEIRQKEREEERELSDKRKELLGTVANDDDDLHIQNDVYLRETLDILADLILLENKKLTVKETAKVEVLEATPVN